MTDGDLVSEKQLDVVQSAVRHIFRVQLAIAAIAGAVLSAVGFLVGFALLSDSDRGTVTFIMLTAGTIVAGVLALGHWRAHRAELRAIEKLRQRVRLGEVLYARDFRSCE